MACFMVLEVAIKKHTSRSRLLTISQRGDSGKTQINIIIVTVWAIAVIICIVRQLLVKYATRANNDDAEKRRQNAEHNDGRSPAESIGRQTAHKTAKEIAQSIGQLSVSPTDEKIDINLPPAATTDHAQNSFEVDRISKMSFSRAPINVAYGFVARGGNSNDEEPFV
uniref:Uncharacterized protein n=1 Tax=Romanomermis culicivorax TaxID=13658 RepID=A0A915K3R7_ROMCU